jgi:hypothetical protein
MQPSEIKEKTCYRAGDQVRYVTSIVGDLVTYNSRGKKWTKDWETKGPWVKAKLDTFAAAVDAQVECHIDLT